MRVSVEIKRLGVEATLTDEHGAVLASRAAMSLNGLAEAAFSAILHLSEFADLSNVRSIAAGSCGRQLLASDGVLPPRLPEN